MDGQGIDLHEILPEKVEVHDQVVSSYTREGEFTSLAVELLKETAIWTSIFACSNQVDQTGSPRKWTRDEAVLMGLMVRLAKLQSGFLDQVCQHRREIADILFRPLIETIINIMYLLSEEGSRAVSEYIEYSLRTEKRLIMDIEENIQNRGYELPIEMRMKNSIMSTFKKSGISPDEINVKDKRAWGKSIRNRARVVDMEDGYLQMLGLPSHAVHGNWQDLITHHLDYAEGEFSPNTQWTHCRPQGVFAVSVFSVLANLTYVDKVPTHFQQSQGAQSLLTDLLLRIDSANELHERFLQK